MIFVTKTLISILIYSFICSLNISVADTPEINCENGEVCREEGTSLPLRILPRPFSNMYKDPREIPENIARENLPAFVPLYAYKIQDLDTTDPTNIEGWYKVGVTTKKSDGWLLAADVMEWRQPLVVAYTHPGSGDDRRKSVLMFDQLEPLQNFIENAESDTESANKVYEKISNKEIVENIVSKEPESFIDIDEAHYIYPILQYQEVLIDGEDARYLQVATQIKGARTDETDATVLTNEEFQDNVTKQANNLESGATLKLDVVFVMDMTGSMGEYIEDTKDAIKEVSLLVTQSATEDDIKFGLIGYRDDVSRIPDIEFTTKNFTPDLVNANEMVEILQNEAHASTVGSQDYQEEVFAGIKEAASESKWREDAIHIIVLAGDASSHEGVEHAATTNENAMSLRNGVLRENSIYLHALHIMDPNAADDHPIAEEQFKSLALVPGSEGSASYYPIDLSQSNAFSQVVKELGTNLTKYLGDSGLSKINSTLTTAGTTSGDTAAKVDKSMAAALVEFIGSGTPPNDLIGWVFDRDPTSPSFESLEVRVLMNKNQLSQLVDGLEIVTQAFNAADITSQNFFDTLQGITGTTTKGSSTDASRLVSSGLLPSFIESLPYKSYVLELTEESFGAMSAEERSEFDRDIVAKLDALKTVNEDVDKWFTLADDPDALEWYPMPLRLLP